MKLKYLFRGSQVISDNGITPRDDYNYNIEDLTPSEINHIVKNHIASGSRVVKRYPVVSMTASFVKAKTKYAGKDGVVIAINKDSLNKRHLRDVSTVHYYNWVRGISTPYLPLETSHHSEWNPISDFEFCYLGSIDNKESVVLPNYLVNLLEDLYRKEEKNLEADLKMLDNSVLMNRLVNASTHIQQIASGIEEFGVARYKLDFKKHKQMYSMFLRWYLNSDCLDLDDFLESNGLMGIKRPTVEELKLIGELLALCDRADTIKVRVLVEHLIDDWLKDKEGFFDSLVSKICNNLTQQTFFKMYYVEGKTLEEIADYFYNQAPTKILKIKRTYENAVKSVNNEIIKNLLASYNCNIG